MSPRQIPSGKKGITMKHAVQLFTVSKALLNNGGSPDLDAIVACYAIKADLKNKYLQWRIVLLADVLEIKLMDLNKVVVLDQTIKIKKGADPLTLLNGLVLDPSKAPRVRNRKVVVEAVAVAIA